MRSSLMMEFIDGEPKFKMEQSLINGNKILGSPVLRADYRVVIYVVHGRRVVP